MKNTPFSIHISVVYSDHPLCRGDSTLRRWPYQRRLWPAVTSAMVRIDVALPAILFLQSGGMAIAALKDLYTGGEQLQRVGDELQALQSAFPARKAEPRNPAVTGAMHRPSTEYGVLQSEEGMALHARRQRQRQGRHTSAVPTPQPSASVLQQQQQAAEYRDALMVYEEHTQLSVCMSAARGLSLGYMAAAFWQDSVGLARGAGRPWAQLSNGHGHMFVGSPEYKELPNSVQDGLRKEALSNLVRRLTRVVLLSSGIWLGSVAALYMAGFSDASPWAEQMDRPTRPRGLLPKYDEQDDSADAAAEQQD